MFDEPKAPKKARRRAKEDSWQARKSASMRELILKSTIDAIVEGGLKGATTQDVINRARISRGALLHHFPHKSDLLKATIEYLLDMRTDAFVARVKSLSPVERHLQVRTLDIFFETLSQESYLALQEFRIAARRDPELGVALERALIANSKRVTGALLENMPEWQPLREEFMAAVDLSASAIEGLVLRPELMKDAKRREAMLALLRRSLLLSLEAAAQGSERAGGPPSMRHLPS